MADPFDTSTAPLTEPESIVAGSYAAWRRELDYSGDAFTVRYRFTPTEGGAIVTLDGSTTDNAVWTFEALSATTTTWQPGEYRWDMLVVRDSDSESALLYTGALKVFSSTGDRRTHAEIMVAKIESILSGRADSDVSSYSIKNRSISKMSVSELIDWREYYRAEVARTGGSMNDGLTAKNNTIRVRFI